MKNINYNEVPREWAVCFQDACPLSGTCLRYAVGELVASKEPSHNCVMPYARHDDSCEMFVSNEPVRVARGMHHLLDGFNEYEAKLIHQRLFDLFGSRSMFYYYRDGRYDIDPDRQEQIANILREFGHSGTPQFDQLEERYSFTE